MPGGMGPLLSGEMGPCGRAGGRSGWGSPIPSEAAMAKKQQQKEAAPASTEGSCFVVHSSAGLYWSGEAWTEDWRQALEFAFPLSDPWLACRAVCDEIRRDQGVVAAPCYFPRAKVGVIDRPGDDAGGAVLP